MALFFSTFCPRTPATLQRASLSVRLSSFPASSRRAATICSQISNGGLARELSVGFLGLGIMGSPMARNLMKAGYAVTVWNRTKSKCDHLLELGAKYKCSPSDVAAYCDVTFAMLADPQSAVEVAFGENGAAYGISPGKGYSLNCFP
ncbi:hypothetical protein Taro_028998 [Colocasia esculenta]|uniref:6-phosphogluconate dehydrogenase NADP-binding domain-containing protein n=1 Tax=Colocasia esculenta TaxID=4460 RepID=A0A843VRZ7_COLES|nr:hypothetical protein [Colocasia esculenta]